MSTMLVAPYVKNYDSYIYFYFYASMFFFT